MVKQHKKTMARERRGNISRRKFLQTGIVTSAALGVGLPSVVAPPAHGVSPMTPAEASAEGFKILTTQQASTLTRVLNRLVPAEGAMLAAGEIGVAKFIDDVMAEAPHLRRPILDMITRVQTASADAPVEGEALADLLTRIEQEHKASFETLLDATYTGYYSNTEVRQMLGATASDRQDTEAFDMSRLQDVIRRGPIYKDV